MPLPMVSSEAAKVRMTERMGPIHGVQPKAKAKPTRNAPIAMLLPCNPCRRLSAYSSLMGTRPVRCNPKMMMITPAILLNSRKCECSAWPRVLAKAPRARKTMEKPRINITEFSMTERIRRESCCFSSSTPAPEISDTYPGTSGRTQGERNEISPAKNAAIGKGNEDMRATLIVTILGFLDVWDPDKSQG